MTLTACELARQAAAATADTLASKSKRAFAEIADCERKLDLIDREVDERVPYAVTLADPAGARELLACMKFVVDLERTGDLLVSAASRIQVIEAVDMADLKDLIEMATVLESMLRDAYQGLATRSVDLAVGIVRADAEIDRRRNLLFFRLLDGVSTPSRSAVHLLFIANELERAGDHTENLGEEICHLVTGRTLRHVRRQSDKPHEQRYLDWLREKAKVLNTMAAE